jgi:hypothetical protein
VTTYQGQGPGSQQQQHRYLKQYVATITGAALGGGVIRITSANHKFQTGDHVTITGVGGTVEANGGWFITRQSGNTFDLNGSTFTNAYTSGGTAKRP